MSKPVNKRLGDIVNFKRGYDLPSYDRKAGPYPIISSSGISGYHSEYKVKGEGLITGRYGTLGEMYYIEGKYWPHNTALYVTDFKGNYPKYVYFLLKCLGSLKTSDKSTVPGVNRNDLHEILVPYIKPELQKPIADLLFILETKIDLNNRINAELEVMAKTLYDFWFVQFDFPGKNGKPYKSSGGKMVWNKELKREIPAVWTAGSLVDLGVIVGGSTPSTTDQDNFSESGTPWITPKDLANCNGNKFISKGELGVSAQGLKSASLKLYPKGTVLLSSRAPIGYMAIARNPLTTNQGFKSIIPSKGYSSHFVYYTLKNSMTTIVQYASGSTFKEVSGTVLKTVLVCLPKSSIVDTYTKTVSSIFDRQDILEQENQHLSSLRDWLLPMLMNGQVKVK